MRSATLVVGIPAPIITFDLNDDPQWTTSGEWAFGTPAGSGGGSYGYSDPSSGATGTNVYGINLNGDYSTSAGAAMYLTTTAIDCSQLGQVSLHFMRWLNSDYQPYVYQTIDVSTNGSAWTPVWSNGESEIAENSWSEQVYDISAVADEQATVYIRWGHQVAQSGAYAYSGWNLDDIEIWGVPSSPLCPWDLNDDGSVGTSDLLALLANWGPCEGCPADFDDNGSVGTSDLLILFANWGPCK